MTIKARPDLRTGTDSSEVVRSFPNILNDHECKNSSCEFLFTEKTPNTVWVYITRTLPPPKKRACRRLIKVTQRYMLTIVGPGMFDLDIFKWMVGEESGERRLICSASPTPLPFLLTVAHPFGTYFFL